MDEDNKNIESGETTETKPKEEKNYRLLIIVLIILAILGGKWIWDHRYNFGDKTISPAPDKPAITQQAFDDLPVGLIYEVSEEEKAQYYELAKQKYEQYKDLGPQQIQGSTSDDISHYQTKRVDVKERDNKRPSDMLNEDMSLRYPDMFYGFIIHDESITGEVSKEYAAIRANGIKGAIDEDYWTRKANQILYVEDYFLNGGKISSKKSSFEEIYVDEAKRIQSSFSPEIMLIPRAVESGFLEFGDNMVLNMFEAMMIPTLDERDFYDIANIMPASDYREYFDQAGNNLVELPYNDVESWPDSNPVYFFPVRVWKVDNHNIMVDIQIEGGDRMNCNDLSEIICKLNFANLGGGSKFEVWYNDLSEYNEDTYVVFGRFFNSDITQGILPDFGVQVINYRNLNGWNNGWQRTQDFGTYVLSDKGKSILKDFYIELKSQLEEGKTPSTKAILKKVAKQHGVSYNDALNIYVSHFCLSTMQIGRPVQWP